MLAKQFRPPVSLSKLTKIKNKNLQQDDIVFAVVASVVNDDRMLRIPRLNICALRFSETARARIEKVGGRAITFDQLALERPTCGKTVLVQGKRGNRSTNKYFKGKLGKHARQRVRKSSHVGRGQEATHTRKRT